MENPGNYCFLISILSLFRNNEDFMNYIFQNSKQNNSFFKKFKEILNEIKTENPKNTKDFLDKLIKTIRSEKVDNTIEYKKKMFVEPNNANDILKKILDYIADYMKFKNEITNYKQTNLLYPENKPKKFVIEDEIINFLIILTNPANKISDMIFSSYLEANSERKDGVLIINRPEFLSFDFTCANNNSIEIENFIKKSEDFNYELVSTLNLEGDYNSYKNANKTFHYNTSFKRNGKWYLVNNNNVKEILTNDDGLLVKKLKSGVLIYKKIKK